MKNSCLSIFIIINLIFINISSSIILKPTLDEQPLETKFVPYLRGFSETQSKNSQQSLKNAKVISSEQNNDPNAYKTYQDLNDISINTKLQYESTEDAVDNNISNVDGSADIGTHSNFISQQEGPDGIYDELKESNSPQQEQIDLKVNAWTNWQDNWAKNGTSPYLDEIDDNNYVYGIQNDNGSSDGDLTGEFEFEDTSITSPINTVKLRVYGSAGSIQPSQYFFYVYLWDGTTWNQEISFKNIGTLTWIEKDVTSGLNNWTKINNAKIYLEVEDPKGNRYGGQICDAALLRISFNTDNFLIDLEEQWTSANYTTENKELAIYTGNLGSEDLRVDVWTGTSWATINNSLQPNQWNNWSVSSYLTSATFTIRFKGTIESNDGDQDTYNIDVVLLHTWISNSPPSVSNITLSPDPLCSNDTLNLSYDYNDAENDSESGTEIRWYRNGVLEGIHNDSKVVPSSALTKGETWNVSIKPSDGTIYGDLQWSTQIFVRNTPPKVSNYYITPSNPVTSSELIASYLFTDYDEDSENIGSREILWFNNSQLVPLLNDSLTIGPDKTLKGQEWYFKIRVHDGVNYSNWVTASSVVINNTAPIASNLMISPLSPKTNNSLTANYLFTDADDDSEKNSIIRWYRNGIYNQTFDNQTTLPYTATKKGESWKFDVQPSDGFLYGAVKTSSSVLIENSAPTSENLMITPSNPVTTNDLILNYDYFDLDNDEEQEPLIIWYKNGILQEYLNNSIDVEAGNTSKGEIWHCKIRVFDGIDYDSWVSIQENITVINSAPSVTGMEITPYPAISQDSLMLEYTFVDNDSDPESNSIILWYKNGLLQDYYNGSLSVDSSNITKNDIWHIKIRPYDGTEYGDWVVLAENITIMNTPPEALNVKILEESPVPNNSDLHVSYTYFDYDSDSQDINLRQIYWYRLTQNGTEFVLQSHLNNCMVVGNENTSTFDYWIFRLYISDGENLSEEYVSGSISINSVANIPPEVRYLNITPSIPLTSDSLYINYTYVDFENDSELGTLYYWYRNGILMPEYNSLRTLPSFATSKGDEIHVKVKPRDGKDFGMITSVSINITITNTPPTASNLLITPNNPITSNNLQLSYEWYDIDDIDTETGTLIIWYLNGELQGDLNNSNIIANSLTAKGQIWHCKVKPSDGTDFGDWISLINNITITNSAPSASNLKITPNSPNTTSSLSASYSFYDPDSDTEQNSYILWYRNGLIIGSFTNSTFIPSSDTSKGENWYYTIIPSDGESYGSLKTSPTITILNSAPTISNLVIKPFPAQTQDTLTINYNFTDLDNDIESGTEYIWYKNGILQGDLNNSRSISSGYTLKGQIWHCKVRPSDGQEFGTWVNLSMNVTIMNTKPTFDFVELFPFGEVYTTSSLIANFEPLDINGDPITETFILWYKNGVSIPELENHTSVSSSYTHKGDNWTYQVSVFDGEDWSLPASPSEEINILNSKPSITNVRLIGGFTTLEWINITYDFFDADGDPESLADSIFNWRIYRNNSWYVEGVPNVKSLDSSWIVAGDSIWVYITPSDGEAAGSQVDSLAYPEGIRIVGNSRPFIVGIPLILDQDETENFDVNSSLNAKYTSEDPDTNESAPIYDLEIDYQTGLVIGAEYRWYKNGELNLSLYGPTVSSQNLVSGDMWILSVRPRDRYGDFGPWVNSSTITIGNSRMAITDIWFTNFDDGKLLVNETFSNINLTLFWEYFDADGDNQIDFEILWYLDNGSGQFTNRPEFENETVISTAWIQKGQIWYASIRSTDGIQWSSYANSSNLHIINSPPFIVQLEYNFPNETLSDVSPTTRTSEFYVVDEDINISYTCYDYDLDESQTRIQWFKQLFNGSWIEMQLFENQTYIDQGNTQAEEYWYAKITPSDGIDVGLSQNSSKILILSRPVIQNINYQPYILKDVWYNLTVKVSDISSQDSIKVQYELIFLNGSSIILNGTSLDGNYWNIIIDLLNCINEIISIKIIVFTQFNADARIYKIFQYSTFSFTAIDESPPRLVDPKFILIKDDNTNPTKLTIFVKLEEYASGITEVILYYYITESLTSPIIGGGSTTNEEFQIEMTTYNESGGIWWFWVSIPYDFGPDVEFHCTVSAKDGMGNSRVIEGDSYYVERLINPAKNELGWIEIIFTLIVSLVLFLSVTFSIIIVKRRIDKEKLKISTLEEKLAFLSDLYVIMVSSSAGIPIWVITSIHYQLDSSLSGNLSGISTGMDSFLNLFQADFMAQMRTEYSLEKDHPEFEKFYKVSVVEQEQVKIMILGSISYRIFVFLKEKPSNFLRETFLLILKDIQTKLPIHDLGVVNEEVLAPNIRKIIKRHLPIDLLKPFRIDYGRISYFDNMLKRNIEESPISRNALNVLKLLAVAVSSSSTKRKKKKILLNIYDTTMLDQTQRYSGRLLFQDAYNLLQKLEGITLEAIYEAFWMGVDEQVKILVPTQ